MSKNALILKGSPRKNCETGRQTGSKIEWVGTDD
jgi:hypothetical protein